MSDQKPLNKIVILKTFKVPKVQRNASLLFLPPFSVFSNSVSLVNKQVSKYSSIFAFSSQYNRSEVRNCFDFIYELQFGTNSLLSTLNLPFIYGFSHCLETGCTQSFSFKLNPVRKQPSNHKASSLFFTFGTNTQPLTFFSIRFF